MRMWNTCIDPQKPRVQIDLATVDGEETEEQEQFQLIIDKVVQVDTAYKLGSFDKIKDLDLNELPMLPATILKGIQDALRSMSPEITNEQVNRGALHFFLHILVATGRALPRQLIPQVDHPSISVPRTNEDLRAIQMGAIPDPQGPWFKFLNTDAGRPPEPLINMLHLLPPLTSSDNGFRLMGQDDMIEVFESLKESLDSRGDPVQSRLWHLVITHTGFDPLNPHMGTFKEVDDEKGLTLFLDDLEENARGPRGAECPPREYMDGRDPPATLLVLAHDSEHTQLHPAFLLRPPVGFLETGRSNDHVDENGLANAQLVRDSTMGQRQTSVRLSSHLCQGWQWVHHQCPSILL